MELSSVIGIDIGGANLKYACLDGRAWSRSFPMWKQREQVRSAITKDLCTHFDLGGDLGGDFREQQTLAITITGELADCFVDRAEGVQYLVAQAMDAAADLGISGVRFYGVDGTFHCGDSATRYPDLIAAANWHALANYVAREILPDALLIDVGSTTTDIVPIRDRQVATRAATDHERLNEGSLVYVGCRRTPVCALVDRLYFRGQSTPVMNELFATIDDAQLLLHFVDESPSDLDTADGQPRTCVAATNRLARMIGLDRRTVTPSEAEDMSAQIIAAARLRIAAGVETLGQGCPIVLSGHGRGLVDLSGREVVKLADRLSADVARCAPSFAVAHLLHSELMEAQN
ncbi:MAG: hydantoinase/oxoprolinase family protein [Rubripirellula sp.]|nr:hydantoinase/oxoprolinase family protein [Rubripirellula sp.]